MLLRMHRNWQAKPSTPLDKVDKLWPIVSSCFSLQLIPVSRLPHRFTTLAQHIDENTSEHKRRTHTHAHMHPTKLLRCWCEHRLLTLRCLTAGQSIDLLCWCLYSIFCFSHLFLRCCSRDTHAYNLPVQWMCSKFGGRRRQ